MQKIKKTTNPNAALTIENDLYNNKQAVFDLTKEKDE